MTPDDIVLRARSAIGKGTVYELGHGGRHPEADHPADAAGRCDCSGLANWACGIDRWQPHAWIARSSGWLSTDGILRDAARPGGVAGFYRPAARPEPGDLVVYGGQSGHHGHVGVIVEMPAGFGDLWLSMRVVHCSSSNFKATGDAIQETDAHVFRTRGVFVRLEAEMIRWVEVDDVPESADLEPDARPGHPPPASPDDPSTWNHRPGPKGTTACGTPARLDRIGRPGEPITCPGCR